MVIYGSDFVMKSFGKLGGEDDFSVKTQEILRPGKYKGKRRKGEEHGHFGGGTGSMGGLNVGRSIIKEINGGNLMKNSFEWWMNKNTMRYRSFNQNNQWLGLNMKARCRG